MTASPMLTEGKFRIAATASALLDGWSQKVEGARIPLNPHDPALDSLVQRLIAQTDFDWTDAGCRTVFGQSLSEVDLDKEPALTRWREVRASLGVMIREQVIPEWNIQDRHRWQLDDHHTLSLPWSSRNTTWADSAPTSRFDLAKLNDLVRDLYPGITVDETPDSRLSPSRRTVFVFPPMPECPTLMGRARDAAIWDLIQSYSSRFDHLHRNHVNLSGMRDLLSALSELTVDSVKYRAGNMRRHEAASKAPEQVKRKSLSELLIERFEKAQKNQKPDFSMEDFTNFPFLRRRALKAKASRTWGIEIEMSQGANLTPPPNADLNARYSWSEPQRNQYSNWTRHRDGSVSGDGTEWVSPVLTTTFDAGLKHMLDQAALTERHSSASCHVHVSIVDKDGVKMNTTHVSRLLELYTMLSPLIWPITQRPRAAANQWCKPVNPTAFAEDRFMREYPEKYRPGTNRGRCAVRTDPVDNWSQKGWDRYTEVNLAALRAHGTIEFRAMGPVYSYEYLTRWAWMLREMCNYACTRLPLSRFAECERLGDVLAILEETAREKFTNPGVLLAEK